jgi:hemolysin activation/secretion protein
LIVSAFTRGPGRLLAVVLASTLIIASARCVSGQTREPGRILPPLAPGPPEELRVPPSRHVYVRRVDVVGSTVLSDDEIRSAAAPFEGRDLASEDLEALRIALTRLYVERGFVNSGVVLPDQTVTDGVVTYHAIEGALTDVTISGNRWFRSGYLRRRLTLGGTPLNVNDLQERIQLLLEDERIRRLAADLKPGLRPGESLLDVRVEDQQPFRLLLDINNHQSPSNGAERGIATVENLNLLGLGDTLSLSYGRSDGLDPLLDFRYAVPVTARDTTVSVQYRRNALTVVEQPFREIGIESETEAFTIGVRQPLYHVPGTLVAAELIGERLSETTTLLGEPFPLLPGASSSGETTVAALRFVLDGVHRTQNQVIAARSRLSVGVDALGATVHDDSDAPDSRFVSWLGQFQWVRRLPVLDSYVIFRSDLQLTPDSLLTLEQIAAGGRFSVRGYRENTVVRDNAFLASVEMRLPLVRDRRWAEYLEVAPFYDYGRAWYAVLETPDPPDLSSVGLGLRWAVTIPLGGVSLRPQAEIYFGYRLRDVRILPNEDPDWLQDVLVTHDSRGRRAQGGIHFQFTVAVF